ncbi:MAG: hypothetical protein D3924_04335 [Candidatus Electrothrix sp. AR4]|nr:hypothetical protein [Candidatus Electrothrix sp. AR4]
MPNLSKSRGGKGNGPDVDSAGAVGQSDDCVTAEKDHSTPLLAEIPKSTSVTHGDLPGKIFIACLGLLRMW